MLLKEVDEKNPIITKFGGTDPITVLHHAACFGKLDIFKNISSVMTNINPKSTSGTSKGATPLHYAALKGHLLVVKHITNCLTNINPADDGSTVMHWAAYNGHVNVINFYLGI